MSVDSIENERLIKRREVKRLAAEYKFGIRRVLELQAALDGTKAELAFLPDAEQLATESTRVELQSIEAAIVEQMASGQAVDNELETRRSALLVELERARGEFTAKRVHLEALCRRQFQEWYDLSLTAGRGAGHENSLANRPLVRPDLLAALELARGDLQWAATRRRAAERPLADARSVLAAALRPRPADMFGRPFSLPQSEIEDVRRQVQRLEAAANLAERQLTEAQQRLECAFQDCINE